MLLQMPRFTFLSLELHVILSFSAARAAPSASPSQFAPTQPTVFPGVVSLVAGASILQLTNHFLKVWAAQHVSG